MINKETAKKDIEGLFCLIVVYAYMIFHSFFSVIGYKSQPGFLEMYSIAILLVSLVLFGILVANIRYITKTEFLLLVSIIYILFSYFIADGIYGHNDTAYGTLLDFIVRAIPAILMAIVAANKGLINNISNAVPL